MIAVSRENLLAALEKPVTINDWDDGFDPWEDVITGIFGSYAEKSDGLMILTLMAVRDRTTFQLIEREGFAAEFMLYVLAGHDLIEYGSSPRGGWPVGDVTDLWDQLIDKWKEYHAAQWGDREWP